eukprot:g3087.t1
MFVWMWVSFWGALLTHLHIRAPLGQVLGHSPRVTNGLSSQFLTAHLIALFITDESWFNTANIICATLHIVAIVRWRDAGDRVKTAFTAAGLDMTKSSGGVSARDVLLRKDLLISLLRNIFPLSVLQSLGTWTHAGDGNSKRPIRIADVKLRDGLSLDIWHDPAASAPKGRSHKPVLLYWHGGSWTFGSKCYNHSLAMFSLLAQQGWIVVSAGYRKAPRFRWDDIFDDAKEALRWVLAADSGLRSKLRTANVLSESKPPQIFLSGSSAGGHIAACVAASLSSSQREVVRGVVLYYPPLDMRDVSNVAVSLPIGISKMNYRKGDALMLWFWENWVLQRDSRVDGRDSPSWSPIECITATHPPVLILHGGLDGLVPFGSSKSFIERLASQKKRKTRRDLLVAVPGQRHAFDAWATSYTVAALDGVSAWLHRELQ